MMRAFTLIEAIVGMTLTLIVGALAASMLVVVFHTQREGQLRNAVTRQATLLVDSVARDVELVGVGVPRGQLAGDDEAWRPALRSASPTALLMVGDVPYPTSVDSGVVQVAGSDPGGGALLLASERTGCTPMDGANDDCDEALRGVAGAGCANGDLTCVFRDKWRPPAGGGPVDIVISFPDGRWVPRQVPFGADGLPARPISVGGRTAYGIDGGAIPVALLSATPGATIAATLDRVYYSIEDAAGAPCPFSGDPDSAPDTPQCTLLRRQCWGYADPEFSLAAGAPPTRTSDAPLACDVPSQGTRWEVISNAINQMRFRYFRADNSELVPPPGATLTAAELARVASVELEVTVIRQLPDGVVQMKQTMMRRIALTAGGGAATLPAAVGGCTTARSVECLGESFQGAR